MSSPVKIEDSSTEYVYVNVVTNEDPTERVVNAAVVAAGSDPSTFEDAEWYGTVTTVGKRFVSQARVLVGPGSDIGALTPGLFDVYLNMVAAPQNIITKVEDQIRVY